MLLKEIELLVPNANEVEVIEASNGDDIIEIACDNESPLSALIFKTVVDPFVGKMSYIKVISGELKSDSTVYNSSTEENEKIGNQKQKADADQQFPCEAS